MKNKYKGLAYQWYPRNQTKEKKQTKEHNPHYKRKETKKAHTTYNNTNKTTLRAQSQVVMDEAYYPKILVNVHPNTFMPNYC